MLRSLKSASIDHDAARRMLSQCRYADESAKADEVAYFAVAKVVSWQGAPQLDNNWPGMLIAAVPVYFESAATEVSRYRAGKKQDREHQEQLARQILEDPHSTAIEREWAHSLIEPLATTVEK